MTKAEPVYLDYAAATPMDPQVVAAMQPFFSDQFHNPGATYLAAQEAARSLERFRSLIAHWIGARPAEVILTAGATEANNLAIRGVMERYPGNKLIISPIEHPSVAETAAHFDHSVAAVTNQGIIALDDLKDLIDDRTVLISIIYASNEIGAIQPLRQIGQYVQAVRKQRQRAGNELPLYLHTDASQAAAYLDIHAARLGVDLLTINGSKIYGPKQSGALYVRTGIGLRAQLHGGGQERGLRSGTESLAHAAGLSTALAIVQNRRHDETARLKYLQEIFFNLLAAAIPDALINGSRKHRLPNNVHITIPGQSAERLILELDQRGVQCAAGSACSASGTKASSVFRALGLDEASAGSSIRFTMGIATTEEHVRRTVSLLAELVHPR